MGEQGFVVCCTGGEERARQADREQLPAGLGTGMGALPAAPVTWLLWDNNNKNAGEYLSEASHKDQWFVDREISKNPADAWLNW